MPQKNELLSDIYDFGKAVFIGTEKNTSIFSYVGRMDRIRAWAAGVILYSFFSIVSSFRHPLFIYWFGLAIFYCVLATIQKRCRDFGSKGTWWVLAATLVAILNASVYFVDTTQKETIWYKLEEMGIMGYCLLVLLLFLIPSKPAEKQIAPDVRTPLLKYPLLYVGVVWILCIVATLMVNHFAGVTIPLW